MRLAKARRRGAGAPEKVLTMPKDLQYVNALYYIAKAITQLINSTGFTPFARHAIENFFAAYESDSAPHDGDSNLIGVATAASTVKFSHIFPSQTAIDMADPADLRDLAVKLAIGAGYAAKPFDASIDFANTDLGDWMLPMVAAAQASGGAADSDATASTEGDQS